MCLFGFFCLYKASNTNSFCQKITLISSIKYFFFKFVFKEIVKNLIHLKLEELQSTQALINGHVYERVQRIVIGPATTEHVYVRCWKTMSKKHTGPWWFKCNAHHSCKFVIDLTVSNLKLFFLNLDTYFHYNHTLQAYPF